VDSAVTARGIGVKGLWGPVYGPVDLDVPAGGVTVLQCPPGSGRVALLMTLAGRMKPETGTLTVCGRTRARDVFAASAIAGIEELDSVPEAVTVRDLITERLRWNAKWYKMIRRADAADLRTVCEPTFGAVPLPELGQYLDDIGELSRTLLQVALANLNRPELLVVGSIDDVSADGDRAVLLERLIALGEHQTVITTTVNPLPDDAGYRQIPVAITAEFSAQQKGSN
jgi:ABC-type multidrug transport system ATPase subunit